MSINKQTRRTLGMTALFAIIAVLASTVAWMSASGEEGLGPSREEVLEVTTLASLSAGRSDLGFDSGSVDSLLNNFPARRGLLETGFLLSAHERAKLDARVELGKSMMGALSRADGAEGFGGARLEHTGNGVFHVYYTPDSEGAAVKADFQSAAPTGTSVQFHVVADSKKELVAQRDRLWTELEDSDIGPGGLHAIGIDIKNNRLVVELDSAISEAERDSSHGLASRLHTLLKDVSYTIIYTELGFDSDCGDFPDDCVSPMMGGIAIKKGSTSGPACSLGFMVKDGSDTQALTAGHCGWSGSTDWYHDGYGSSRFGYEIDDDAYFDFGRDGMLVQMPESQGSNDIAYCVGRWGCVQITGYLKVSDLYEGMPLNVLGQASGHRSGTIHDIGYSWWSDTCECPQYGIAATYSSVDGDSGGPVWYGYDAIALHASGASAPYRRAVQVQPLLSFYNVDLRTS